MGFNDGYTIMSGAVNWLDTPTSLFDNFSTLDVVLALVFLSFIGMIIGRLMRGKRYQHTVDEEPNITAPEPKYYDEDELSPNDYRDKYGVGE